MPVSCRSAAGIISCDDVSELLTVTFLATGRPSLSQFINGIGEACHKERDDQNVLQKIILSATCLAVCMNIVLNLEVEVDSGRVSSFYNHKVFYFFVCELRSHYDVMARQNKFD